MLWQRCFQFVLCKLQTRLKPFFELLDFFQSRVQLLLERLALALVAPRLQICEYIIPYQIHLTVVLLHDERRANDDDDENKLGQTAVSCNTLPGQFVSTPWDNRHFV